ncbi:MAG: enoyl-CoA hydratase/isomerase family protein [Clostridia bacterium]|nr:enoyl-CoA hydratase/isomerase family protein [Clostridia bacterium]
MKYSTVHVERVDGVALLQLNRPDKLNALSPQLVRDMKDAIEELSSGGKMRVLIITGSGRAFCAGADISEIQKLGGPLSALAFVDEVNDLFNLLEALPYPVIAAVNGMALGGGCELCLACDLRLASERAVFGQPEIKIGVIPGGGGTQRLPRVVGLTKGKEMLLLGDSIGAEEALRIGLVNKVVPGDRLLEEAKALAGKLAGLPAVGLRMIKEVVNEGIDKDLRTAIEYEKKAFALMFSTEDQKEGVRAFLEKREPSFTGS